MTQGDDRYLGRHTLTPSSQLERHVALIALLFAFQSAGAAPLHLDFLHEIDGRPLSPSSLRYKNSSRESYSLTRLEWLATGFIIKTNSGDSYSLKETRVFIPTMGTTISLTGLPEIRISAITFHIGPDQETNHSDPARYTANHPLNPNINKLHWDWQDGYIFIAAEGHWRAAGEKLPGGFGYHFARDSNRTAITLPVDINLRDETRVAISLDAARLLAGLSFAKDGTTTHSAEGDPVAARLKSNLQTAFRIAGIQRGGVPPPPNPPDPIDLPANPKGFPISLPKHVPLPAFPPDNPILTARVALGKRLFHEAKLSLGNTMSCASCHQGGTLSDPRRFSPGVHGEHSNRHSMPLFNLAWKSSFFWDGRAPSLRAQSLKSIENHLEMDQTLAAAVSKLQLDQTYPSLFSAAFGSGIISPENIGLAIENFLLTLISVDSKFDQHLQGKVTLTAEEQRGLELFYTEFEPRLGKFGADCFHCHGGALFTDHSFHNNGLATTDDLGVGSATGKASDRYKFSTPSLRNIALTAPYMHDGRFATLEEVIDHYSSNFERNETLDPNLAKHPSGLRLSGEDKNALISFLKTLTDDRLD